MKKKIDPIHTFLVIVIWPENVVNSYHASIQPPISIDFRIEAEMTLTIKELACFCVLTTLSHSVQVFGKLCTGG